MIKNNFIIKLKNILVLAALIIFFNESKSQPLFVENFNFPVRDSLENIGNWYRTGPITNYNVKVVSSGLTYPGYTGSGIGNTSFFSNQSFGDVILNSFTAQSSGTVYLSFMISVDSLTASATENYNICLDEEGGATNLNTKIFIRKISSSTYNIGIKKYDGPVKYSAAVYSKNTTYLVICSYNFRAGLNNDIARLYVSTSGVPATEPVSPAAADTLGPDVNNIGEIILTNQFLQADLHGSSVKIDGIRIGTSWNATLFQPYNVQLNLKALIQGFYNGSTNKMVKDTARVYLRYKTAPYTIADSSKAVLDSNGNGNFIFTRIGNSAPYYIVVKHRNTVDTWSWSASYFYDNIQDFDFTPSPSYAYGSNQIHIGSKYCLYNGDVNQDGLIDLTDVVAINNNAAVFLVGYKTTDIDGNNITDLADLIITYNNSSNFVSVKKP